MGGKGRKGERREGKERGGEWRGGHGEGGKGRGGAAPPVCLLILTILATGLEGVGRREGRGGPVGERKRNGWGGEGKGREEGRGRE